MNIARRIGGVTARIKEKLHHSRQVATHWLSGTHVRKNIIILLTNPRSGSTWLLDVLRCHPLIDFYPRYTLYQQLGLTGRRYPRDLSDGPKAVKSVEVRPSVWASVPSPRSEVEWGSAFSERERINYAYNIEKIHPHFFEHRIDEFFNRVGGLDNKHEIEFVCQVRDPKESIISFLEYQKRNPYWNAHRNNVDVIRHMEEIYGSIKKVAERESCLVIDYSAMVINFNHTINSIFEKLFPDVGTCLSDDILDSIYMATRRDKKYKTGTDFVGKRKASDCLYEYNNILEYYKDDIEKCYETYNNIMDMNMVVDCN